MPPVVDTTQPQPQAPQGRYPTNTGKRYWGEFAGYTYDPYSDAYYPSREVYEQYQQQSGLAPPKPRTPSPWESVVPIAALAGTTWALSESGRNTLGGLFGGGAEPVASGAANSAANTAGSLFGNELGGFATGGGGGGGEALMGLGETGPFSYGANANPISGFNLGGEVPAGLTQAGEFSGMTPAAPGMFELGGIGSAGNVLLPAAGAIGAYDLFANERKGGRGALQGAASGAAMGSYFGPWGAGIGAGIGLGAGLLGGMFGSKEKFKTEGKRVNKLREQGVYVPDIFTPDLKKGQTKDELIARARATGGNVKFAGSRLESDLTAPDIVGYMAFAENDPQWFNKPLQDRLEFAQRALDSGAVREHHGTIDVDFGKISAAPPSSVAAATVSPQTAGVPAVQPRGAMAPNGMVQQPGFIPQAPAAPLGANGLAPQAPQPTAPPIFADLTPPAAKKKNSGKRSDD